MILPYARSLLLVLAGCVHAVAGPAEIAAFWRATLDRLAAEPVDAVEEQVRDPLPYNTYRVEYRSLGGVRIRAHLAIPIRGGQTESSLPAIVTVPGYGGNQQGVMLDECQRGYAILQVYPRSQGPSAELWKIDAGEKLTWRLDRPEGAYYQLAYADVVRGIDYLASRKGIDRDRIAIAGTSQGGGIALAVASLDARLRAVVAHVPFLCDMRQAARTEGSLVKKLLDGARVNDDVHLRTLDYFDPVQLAPFSGLPHSSAPEGRTASVPRQPFTRFSIASLRSNPSSTIPI